MINEITEDMYSNIDANFIAYIINELLTRGFVSEKKRLNFKDDVQYLDF